MTFSLFEKANKLSACFRYLPHGSVIFVVVPHDCAAPTAPQAGP